MTDSPEARKAQVASLFGGLAPEYDTGGASLILGDGYFVGYFGQVDASASPRRTSR
ncbi:MAG TPA: hypothetical protein VFH48_20450 [Chloroflexota bacterium]|nr:hypothetical protein [Chloroflexota bacterium]